MDPPATCVDSAIPSGPLGDRRPVTDAPIATIGLGPAAAGAGRHARPGDRRRRTSARAGDPFTAVRVIDLLARVERGRPIRLADIADRLERDAISTGCSRCRSSRTSRSSSRRTGWPITATARASSIEDGPTGPTLTIEDSSRVDPWIVRQAQRVGRRRVPSGSPSSADATDPRPATDPTAATHTRPTDRLHVTASSARRSIT